MTRGLESASHPPPRQSSDSADGVRDLTQATINTSDDQSSQLLSTPVTTGLGRSWVSDGFALKNMITKRLK